MFQTPFKTFGKVEAESSGIGGSYAHTPPKSLKIVFKKMRSGLSVIREGYLKKTLKRWFFLEQNWHQM